MLKNVKKIKILFKRKILILVSIIIICLLIFIGLVSYFISKNQNKNSSVVFTDVSAENFSSFSSVEKENFNLPVRLRIPTINVDANFIAVGFTHDGAMDVPRGPAEVGWFSFGPRPGENGSSVVDGHSGWKNNIPAVFDNLYKLKKGDKIYVEDDGGAIITFVVRESKKYGPHDNVPEVFITNDGKSHLNLITCTGIWNIFSKSRSNRLVVFADKETILP
jgi:LPXTG-site transpeptidase (sortase) family protein